MKEFTILTPGRDEGDGIVYSLGGAVSAQSIDDPVVKMKLKELISYYQCWGSSMKEEDFVIVEVLRGKIIIE